MRQQTFPDDRQEKRKVLLQAAASVQDTLSRQVTAAEDERTLPEASVTR